MRGVSAVFPAARDLFVALNNRSDRALDDLCGRPPPTQTEHTTSKPLSTSHEEPSTSFYSSLPSKVELYRAPRVSLGSQSI